MTPNKAVQAGAKDSQVGSAVEPTPKPVPPDATVIPGRLGHASWCPAANLPECVCGARESAVDAFGQPKRSRPVNREERVAQLQREIAEHIAEDERACNCGKPVCVPESEWRHAVDCPAFHVNRGAERG